MATEQITLTDTERDVLRSMAERTGKTEEQIVHEALESFLVMPSHHNRLALLRRAKGIWKDREDIPSVREMRTEFDRF